MHRCLQTASPDQTCFSSQALDDSGLPSKRRNDGRSRRGPRAPGSEEEAEEADFDTYKSAEQIHEELEMRQASREELKAVLRAVMQLSSGEDLLLADQKL